MSRARDIVTILAVFLAWGCGSTIKSKGDTGTDAPVDATDVVMDTAEDPAVDGDEDPTGDPAEDPVTDGGCTPGETRCTSDLNSIEECQTDGTWLATECPFGCSNTPTPHCLEWDISNLPDDTLLTEGRDPTDPAWPTEGNLWVQLDTDTGAVDIYDTSEWSHVREVRPGTGEGLHIGSGIHFEIVAQGEGLPELGVFTFRQLEIPSNYVYGVWGSRPMVLLSELSATIDGGVYAGCFHTTEPLGGARNAGEGPGAGDSGMRTGSGSTYTDGGGGGGAYGGPGGNGGGDSAIRGTGGSSYGTEELVPLAAGSGGGDGGGVAGGRHGGRSGGAVQIVSGATLTLGATGWIDAGGCGGTGAEDFEGGGGAGSGGGILIEAPELVLAGSVTSNGGGGAGGGGPVEPTNGEDSRFGTDTAAAGGAPGNWGCEGGEGSGASSYGGANAPNCSGAYNFGGGGGGAGIIRINGHEVDTTGCLFSPSMSVPATTQGGLTLL